MRLPNFQSDLKIHGGVEPENIVSQKFLLASGFIRINEEDGIIKFEKEINR